MIEILTIITTFCSGAFINEIRAASCVKSKMHCVRTAHETALKKFWQKHPIDFNYGLVVSAAGDDVDDTLIIEKCLVGK